MGDLKLIREEVFKNRDEEKAKNLSVYFKTQKWEYGEGDIFLGVKVPILRKISKKYYKDLDIDYVESLLIDSIHEYRFLGLVILIEKFKREKSLSQKEKIISLYLKNTKYINNWDLVDISAYNLLGEYLLDKDRSLLYELTKSENIWEQRISIISTFAFIRKGDYEDILNISRLLIDHPHHLIQKAIGWMLREVGKRDFEVEYNFLRENYKNMPRTMLRYSIERFDQELRKDFLNNRV